MPAALVYALPEITAAFPLFWPAIGAILMLYAVAIVFRNPLVAALSAIPVIGGAAAGAVSDAAEWMARYISGWAESLVWPLIQLLLAPAAILTAFTGAVVGSAEYLMDRVRVTAQAANAEFGRVASSLGNLDRGLGSALAQLGGALLGLQAARSTIDWIRGTQVPAAKSQAISSSGAYTRGQVGAEAKTRASEIDQVRAETRTLHHWENLALDSAKAGLQAQIAAEAAALSVAIAQLGAKDQHYTDQRVAGAEAAAAAALAKGLTAVRADARAQVKVVADELTGLRTGCIDPLCGAFGPAVGLWSQLATGAELLALLGMVQAATSDPQGAARGMAGLAGALHDGAAAMLSPFIGRA